MSGKDKITVGVFGAGRIGKLHIENIIHNIPEARIKTVVDISIAHLRDWAKNLGIENLSTNEEDILKDEEIQAVLICSSTDTHADYICKAADVKKDIFCEKPIDANLAKIKETLAVVEKAGVKLMVGFNRRFDHNFKRARDRANAGDIGVPHIIKITSRDPSPPPIEYVKVSGGLFFDMTIHDWDMARYLAGSEVEEVYAIGDALVNPDIKGIDIDTAVATLKFKNGAIGMIDNSRQAVYGYDQRVEIFGSKGALMVENDVPNTVKYYSDKDTSQDKIPLFFLERYMQSYTDEMKEFFACLKENKEPSVGGIDGLNAVLIAMAAMKSLKENRPVKISEVDK
jgi:myo-inositol 2-dehydrogenase / D-chiro-inositol 1-dehydrogenase